MVKNNDSKTSKLIFVFFLTIDTNLYIYLKILTLLKILEI